MQLRHKHSRFGRLGLSGRRLLEFRSAVRCGAVCLLLAGHATVASADSAAARPAVPWSDSFTTRLEALALLQSLNADLLSHNSATLTLDRWCEAHRMASPAKVVAERVRDADKPPTAELRQTLAVGEDETIRYRRVRLRCGEHVLSEADNWYVPSRLTPEMNHALESSDIAFGRAVQALHFQRRTLKAELLWSPLPEGWEMNESAEPARASGANQPRLAQRPVNQKPAILEVPAQVLQHQAVLTVPDGTPISVVVETYTSAVLSFPEPTQRTSAH
jgi:chorismate-pyruvate lyase